MVGLCRRYLAEARLKKIPDPKRAKMFQTAREELTDRLLADLRRAGRFEREGKWSEAMAVYEEIQDYLVGADDPIWENVADRKAWCWWKQYDKAGGGN